MHFGNLASLLIVYHITKTEMVGRKHARFLNINLGLAIFLIDHVCGEKRVKIGRQLREKQGIYLPYSDS